MSLQYTRDESWHSMLKPFQYSKLSVFKSPFIYDPELFLPLIPHFGPCGQIWNKISIKNICCCFVSFKRNPCLLLSCIWGTDIRSIWVREPAALVGGQLLWPKRKTVLPQSLCGFRLSEILNSQTVNDFEQTTLTGWETPKQMVGCLKFCFLPAPYELNTEGSQWKL